MTGRRAGGAGYPGLQLAVLRLWELIAGIVDYWDGTHGDGEENEYLHVCQQLDCKAAIERLATLIESQCANRHTTVAATLHRNGTVSPAFENVRLYIHACLTCDLPYKRSPQPAAGNERPSCPLHRTELTLIARPRRAG